MLDGYAQRVTKATSPPDQVQSGCKNCVTCKEGPALLEAPPRAWLRNACFGQLCNEGAELRCGVTLSHVTRSGASTGAGKQAEPQLEKGRAFWEAGRAQGNP